MVKIQPGDLRKAVYVASSGSHHMVLFPQSAELRSCCAPYLRTQKTLYLETQSPPLESSYPGEFVLLHKAAQGGGGGEMGFVIQPALPPRRMSH